MKISKQLSALLLGTLTPNLFSQTDTYGGGVVQLYTNNGETVAKIGDVNGDGFEDILIGEPDFARASVISSTDGSLIYQYTDQVDSRFGELLAPAGDIDLDGIPDFMISAPLFDSPSANRTGKVDVYSGATGIVIHSFLGSLGNQQFGRAISPVSDINADGADDILIVRKAATLTPGRVTAFSGMDGSELWQTNGTFGVLEFGDRMIWARDLNQDGISDFLINHISSPTSNDAIGVYSGSDGSLIFEITDPGGGGFSDSFGMAWDFDGDSTDDIVVVGYIGRENARILSGRTGLVLDAFNFGWGQGAIDTQGDLDGDGWRDISSAGTVVSGRTREFLWNVITDPVFFHTATFIGDIDNTGRDVYVTAQADPFTPDGTLAISFYPCISASETDIRAALGSTVNLEFEFPPSAAHQNYAVLLSTSLSRYTHLGGIGVPLRWSPMLSRSRFGNYPFSTYSDLQSVLDYQAKGTASFTTAPGQLAGLVGKTFFSCAVSFPPGPTLSFSSVSVAFTVVP